MYVYTYVGRCAWAHIYICMHLHKYIYYIHMHVCVHCVYACMCHWKNGLGYCEACGDKLGGGLFLFSLQFSNCMSGGLQNSCQEIYLIWQFSHPSSLCSSTLALLTLRDFTLCPFHLSLSSS